jgi:hypothetical protein
VEGKDARIRQLAPLDEAIVAQRAAIAERMAGQGKMSKDDVRSLIHFARSAPRVEFNADKGLPSPRCSTNLWLSSSEGFSFSSPPCALSEEV